MGALVWDSNACTLVVDCEETVTKVTSNYSLFGGQLSLFPARPRYKVYIFPFKTYKARHFNILNKILNARSKLKHDHVRNMIK